MALQNPNQNQVGAFIPTTDIYDVTEIYQIEVTSPEFKELLVRLYQNLNRMATTINVKDSGYYDTVNEFVCGQLYFPHPNLNSAMSPSQYPEYRQVLRRVLNLPQVMGIALPATTTITIAHSIVCTANTTFTNLSGMASDTVNFFYYPINYAGASTISSYADNTNVYITNNTAVNFTVCYAVLEYLQE